MLLICGAAVDVGHYDSSVGGLGEGPVHRTTAGSHPDRGAAGRRVVLRARPDSEPSGRAGRSLGLHTSAARAGTAMSSPGNPACLHTTPAATGRAAAVLGATHARPGRGSTFAREYWAYWKASDATFAFFCLPGFTLPTLLALRLELGLVCRLVIFLALLGSAAFALFDLTLKLLASLAEFCAASLGLAESEYTLRHAAVLLFLIILLVRVVHVDSVALQVLSVHGLARTVRAVKVIEGNEAVAARAASLWVALHFGRKYNAKLAENFSQQALIDVV
eukprot:CAMPEP_0185573324 /NCGR_PEP_ID=MMETSP0434-20130131/5079_1 /TAXON_ID=626734 ORGANISM="Favella taraikaensis, Strain Fe Narragansett Bay" /NCGR_SAMPLE_ID=MMETSP0434 /ASSEMBLY_ACC=CAM_ASM_000379 /LENGTH=276 /DNA_ID=CAMNT_0028189529 /DNA_START=27 /DNA_END=858 /DNA_ORIENTATION=-